MDCVFNFLHGLSGFLDEFPDDQNGGTHGFFFREDRLFVNFLDMIFAGCFVMPFGNAPSTLGVDMGHPSETKISSAQIMEELFLDDGLDNFLGKHGRRYGS
ncbi:MAG: hypothetical protein Q8Q26_08335, partial [Pseudorhodobacter sp.]|nr:hypothetical protein [Pseudorhodobacter sp.]